jgi:hypothetical protein
MAREKARMHFDKAVGPWFFFIFIFSDGKAYKGDVGLL